MFEEVDERERKMPIMFEKDKFGKWMMINIDFILD